MLHSYSQLFITIHDESQPVGNIGRGTHYSILRARQFFDNTATLQVPFKNQDFCIIWDEDHDVRVLQVVEQLYLKNMLSPVLFIGERKGGVYVLLDRTIYNNRQLYNEFAANLDDIAQNLDDPWCSDVGYMDIVTKEIGNSRSLIQDDEEKAIIYLNNINNLWSLGQKKFIK